MKSPNLKTLFASAAGGVIHLGVVHLLYSQAGYPPNRGLTPMEAVGIAFLGALAIGILAHTRLVVPALGLTALVVWIVHLELVAGPPLEYHYLGDNLVYAREPYLQQYVGTWYIWVPLLLAGATTELGIRDGYTIARDSLRNVPSLPFSERQLAVAVGGCALLFAVCLYHAMGYVGVQAWSHQVEGFIGGGIFLAVTLWGVLTRGLISPVVLSLLIVVQPTPRVLVRDGLGSSFSLLFFLTPIIVLVALLEWYLRYRIYSGNGLSRSRFNAQ